MISSFVVSSSCTTFVGCGSCTSPSSTHSALVLIPRSRMLVTTLPTSRLSPEAVDPQASCISVSIRSSAFQVLPTALWA